MTRIAPLNYNYDYDIEELDGVCPRYIKWIKRVKAFDFSKPKKVTIERKIPTFNIQEVESIYHSTPVKSLHKKNVFSRLRRSGKNFKVRCKTSADLWRRWISGDNQNESDANAEQTTSSNEKEANDETSDSKAKLIDTMVNKVDDQTKELVESKQADDARVVNNITIVETEVTGEQSIISKQNIELVEQQQNDSQVDVQTINSTKVPDIEINMSTNVKIEVEVIEKRCDEKELSADDDNVAIRDDNTDNKITEKSDNNETIEQNETMPTNSDTEPLESEVNEGMASVKTVIEEDTNNGQLEKQAIEEEVVDQTSAHIIETQMEGNKGDNDVVEAHTNGVIGEQTEGQSSERREELHSETKNGQSVDIDNDIDIAEFTKSILLNL